MFGKYFACTFTGSMLGAGSDVFAVWGYVIANTKGGVVELNPRLLAAMIGAEPAEMKRAIDYLCAPDPDSKSKLYDGARLVRVGEFSFHVPNHDAYRSIRDETDRQVYMQNYMRERRAKEKAAAEALNSVNTPVNTCKPPLAHTEAEAEADEKKSKRTSSMSKPTLVEVTEYGKTLDPPFTESGQFIDYYESNGWKVGKNPMKDWKAAVRNWNRNSKKKPQKPETRPMWDKTSYQKNGQQHPQWPRSNSANLKIQQLQT